MASEKSLPSRQVVWALTAEASAFSLLRVTKTQVLADPVVLYASR